MISKLEWLIAFRYLRAKKQESVISVIAIFSLLGVMLGVAALIVVMSVMNGFHDEISQKMTGFNGDIMIYGYNNINNYDELANQIKSVEHVSAATPMVELQVMAMAKNNASGVLAKGINNLTDKAIVVNNMVLGSFNDFYDNNIVIGYELANSLHVSVNDSITLVSPQGNVSIIGFVPKMKAYNIIGIFKSGMYNFDNSTVFIPLESAQKLANLQSKVNAIEVMVDNLNISNQVSETISNAIGPLFQVNDWKITNATFFNVLKTERVVMFVILTLIIIVAAFNIISSLIMLVKDKAKAVAILRTMGASRAMILKIFILCGSSIGVIGTMLGMILGLTFAYNLENIRKLLEKWTGNTIFDPIVYYLYALPVKVETCDSIKIVTLSLFLSLIATIYPAWKAAKTNPLQGLRYE